MDGARQALKKISLKDFNNQADWQLWWESEMASMRQLWPEIQDARKRGLSIDTIYNEFIKREFPMMRRRVFESYLELLQREQSPRMPCG